MLQLFEKMPLYEAPEGFETNVMMQIQALSELFLFFFSIKHTVLHKQNKAKKVVQKILLSMFGLPIV